MKELKFKLERLGAIREAMKEIKKEEKELTEAIKEGMTGNTFQSENYVASITDSKRKTLDQKLLALKVSDNIIEQCKVEKSYQVLHVKQK